ncbi:MAG: efflux RND transporter periplasmic adaptor subunit [Candidatus Brocadiae bacterium]|nr:efflux RND transporter periplasmic adaptor subunit [Candidatus Brocadiia bacterium]
MRSRNGLAACIALLVAGCGPSGSPVPAQPAGSKRLPRVLVVQVESRTLSWIFTAMGEIEPREQVQVSAQVPGVVSRLTFVEGDTVTAETVLCTIDEERYLLEEERAKADLDRAKAEQVRARGLHAQRVPLFEEKIISAEELADARASMDRADADVARADVQLRLAAKSLRDCRVRPPIPGRIESRLVATGEYVAAGTAIATIVDVSELRVRFVVPETESARIRRGLTLSWRPRGTGPAVAGEVYWVSLVADPGTRTVACRARLEGVSESIRPGSSGTVTLSLEARDGSVVVPAEAVFPTERGFVAFVLEGTRARSRTLKIGVRTEDDGLEVLEGLAPGETLILRGGSSLKDGQEVEVAQ